MHLTALGPTPSRLIFLHIPKTAGTTFNHVLSRQYSAAGYYAEPSPIVDPPLHDFLNAPKTERAAVRVVTGHFPFGVHRCLQQPTAYVTFLRDPVERVLSQYAHVARDPDRYFHQRYPAQASPRLDLETYLRAGFTEIDNWQTRVLAGQEAMDLPFGECDRDVLEQARYNMRSGVALTGLTERFDETLVLLQHWLGWSMPCYVKERVGQNRLRRNQITTETLALIHHQTRWDRELYDFAAARFADLIAEQGAAFPAAVRRLHSANLLYRTVKRLARSGAARALKERLPNEQKIKMDAAFRTTLGHLPLPNGGLFHAATVNRSTLLNLGRDGL